MLKTAKSRKIATIITAIVCIAVFVLYYFNSQVGIDEFGSNDSFGEDYVKILDVGQGDSILIHSNGYSALIDTGYTDNTNDLLEGLRSCGIKQIDVLILSHLHTDHTGGVESLFGEYKVNNVILPELSTYSEGIYAAQMAIDKVTRAGGGVYGAKQGMNFNLGDFEITVLASYGGMFDENNRSLVIMAKIGKRKFLLTGDMESAAEKRLLEENLNLDCDVLKVGHHGSNTSSTKAFLKAASPRYAAISVGAGNPYGHPHKEALKRLEYTGAEIYRTDKSGDITFTVENENISVKTER